MHRIVAPQDKGPSSDLDISANESQNNKKQSTDHKENGAIDPRPDITDDEALREAAHANGSSPAEPASPHSPEASQASKRSSAVSTSPVARPAATPPPSPEYKENRAHETVCIKGENTDDVDVYAITTDTPPPSRKSSLLKLKRPEPEPTPASLQEHDPATTNPFIVDAPYVKPPCYIDYGTNLHVGAGTFINRNFMVIDSPVCQIRIGDRCLFGPNVILAAVEHPLGKYSVGSRECILGKIASRVIACTQRMQHLYALKPWKL